MDKPVNGSITYPRKQVPNHLSRAISGDSISFSALFGDFRRDIIFYACIWELTVSYYCIISTDKPDKFYGCNKSTEADRLRLRWHRVEPGYVHVMGWRITLYPP